MARPFGRLDALRSLTLYEQRRLELLMRLVQQPKLLMLDEPGRGLSRRKCGR